MFFYVINHSVSLNGSHANICFLKEKSSLSIIDETGLLPSNNVSVHKRLSLNKDAKKINNSKIMHLFNVSLQTELFKGV